VSAVVRLWRRAPLWRAGLLVAAASTLLALAWPPQLDHTPPPRAGQYALPPAVANPFLTYPHVYRILAFGSGQVPLPAGEWTSLIHSNDDHVTPSVIGELLVHLVDKRLVAAVSIRGTSAPKATPDGWKLYDGCTSAHVVVRVRSHANFGPQDCWLINPVMQPADWAGASLPIIPRGLEVLGRNGIALPPVMLMVNFFLADDRQWRLVTYWFAPGINDPAPTPQGWASTTALNDPAKAAYIARMTDWTTEWAVAVRLGFAGTLRPDDISAALATRAY
jgi:hypothetical protein